MSKLSYEEKIKIYEEHKQGSGYSILAKKYNLNSTVVQYMLYLIDRHGYNILKTSKNNNYPKYFKEEAISRVLKNGEVIGQMTVQSNSDYDNLAIRNIGWYINPKYQGLGYATEAAMKIIEFMFNVVEIDSIITEANVVNCGSWKLMEKLGFERTGESVSNHIDDEGKNLMQYNYLLTKEKYEINKENSYKKGR